MPDAAAPSEGSADTAVACAGQAPTMSTGRERGRRRQRTKSADKGVELATGDESGGGGYRGASWRRTSGREGSDRANAEKAPQEKESYSAAAAAAAAASGPPRRGRSSSFGSLPSGSRPSLIELEGRPAEHLPLPRDKQTRHHRAASGGSSHTGRTRDSTSGGGSGAAADQESRRFDGGRRPLGQPVQRVSSARVAGAAVRADHGGSGGGSGARRLAGELGSSWGSAATTGRLSTLGFGGGTRQARPLDGSRGESLQRSLAEALEVRLCPEGRRWGCIRTSVG